MIIKLKTQVASRVTRSEMLTIRTIKKTEGNGNIEGLKVHLDKLGGVTEAPQSVCNCIPLEI